jgi:cell fate regulator YaaT (PSP1 superfamily)
VLGQHWVRFGVLGHVGRFAAEVAERFPRGTRVICRTRRGLEVGEILAPLEAANHDEMHGTLLRRMTSEDDLLLTRLDRNRDEAFLACSTRLRERGVPAVLVDVEHLFDGQSLFFYFLGGESPEIAELTSELAETYEAKVQFRKFTETLTQGCGPGCGTEEAENGCGSGACSTCAVLSACGTVRSNRL